MSTTLSLSYNLSIIVPFLNEAAELQGLFDSLATQCNVSFELILCDGGSSDTSSAIAQERAQNSPFPVTILQTAKGRARQMNAGADKASAPLLLFLHADSRFAATDALATAVSYYRQNITLTTGTVAARFKLRFRRTSDAPSMAYAYYEQKAQLNRSDCIRGDQGFMISGAAFRKLGLFDISLPFLEDVRMAAEVAKHGSWLLIPAEISTSARRFETEGLYERQALNAIISCCAELGWEHFFVKLPMLYGSHGGKIDLTRMFREIRTLIAEQPKEWRRKFWKDTGRYVAANSWQVFFWLDVRHSFCALPDYEIRRRWLSWYEHKAAHVFNSQLAGYCAMVLTWIWFRCR